MLRAVIRGSAEAVDIGPEYRSAYEIAFKGARKEIGDLADAVFVCEIDLRLCDQFFVELCVRVLPASFTGRIYEQHARIGSRSDVGKSALFGKSNRFVFSETVLLKHQQKRCPEAVIVHLSVDRSRGHIRFQVKMLILMLPVLSAVSECFHLRSCHDPHSNTSCISFCFIRRHPSGSGLMYLRSGRKTLSQGI